MGHDTADPAFPAVEQLALDAILHRRLGEQCVPGAVAGIWIPGRGNWMQASGIGNLQTAAPITPEDHHRIASVSKTFVATVLLQLVDEGRLSLADTLDRFASAVPNSDRITIRQLLGMSAGIFNYVNDPGFEHSYTSDPLLPFPRRQILEILSRHEPDFAPGEQVRYSDSNYFLAGFIIEQLTGRSASAEITSRVLEPLRLHGTSLPDTPQMPRPHARGYGATPGAPELRDITESNPEVPWTAGAMVSTLHDLRVWSKALAEGALLSTSTQQERLQFAPLDLGSDSGIEMGYGLGIMDLHGFLGHAGAIFGYSTWMLHSPAENATLVVLANRGETETEFASKITVDILRLLFPDHFPHASSVAS